MQAQIIASAGLRPIKALPVFEAELAAVLPQMHTLALRYTRHPQRAHDLVQDAVVKVLAAKDSYQDGGSFARWSLTILTNTFYHHYRRFRLERRVLDKAQSYDLGRATQGEHLRATGNAEQVMLDRDVSRDVVLALSKLPSEYRLVVALCDLQGLMYKEAAAMLDCPLGTIMSRLHRGRRQLRTELEAITQRQKISQNETMDAASEPAVRRKRQRITRKMVQEALLLQPTPGRLIPEEDQQLAK